MKVNRNSIELSFTQIGSGLISAGASYCQGNKVLVSSAAVQQPVVVRFAWNETAMPNLCNKEKLPASPFRTDSWK